MSHRPMRRENFRCHQWHSQKFPTRDVFLSFQIHRGPIYVLGILENILRDRSLTRSRLFFKFAAHDVATRYNNALRQV